MNMPMISSTYFQRNIGKILDNLTEPIIILRGSKPEAVIMPYKQFLEMVKSSKKIKSRNEKRS
jgi:PHD/YefM family antitoxin component YafN of YafNO toxin-antitoxin module